VKRKVIDRICFGIGRIGVHSTDASWALVRVLAPDKSTGPVWNLHMANVRMWGRIWRIVRPWYYGKG